MPSASSSAAGEDTLLLAGLDPAECKDCGAQYDQRSGVMLPVYEGYQPPESGSASTVPAID